MNTTLPEAAPGEAGRPRGEHVVLALGIEHRVQQLVERGRLDAADRLVAADHALPRPCRTAIFSAAWAVRLPVRVCSIHSLPLLDRELDVLHVAVVRLELLAHLRELGEDLRHHLFHRRQRRAVGLLAGERQVLRRADAGDDVLALGVDQVLAVELLPPVDGSRVKATPVAQSSPMLPNTIACTLTAVPQSSGMLCSRR